MDNIQIANDSFGLNNFNKIKDMLQTVLASIWQLAFVSLTESNLWTQEGKREFPQLWLSQALETLQETEWRQLTEAKVFA